jgi:hypothetical protein
MIISMVLLFRSPPPIFSSPDFTASFTHAEIEKRSRRGMRMKMCGAMRERHGARCGVSALRRLLIFTRLRCRHYCRFALTPCARYAPSLFR